MQNIEMLGQQTVENIINRALMPLQPLTNIEQFLVLQDQHKNKDTLKKYASGRWSQLQVSQYIQALRLSEGRSDLLRMMRQLIRTRSQTQSWTYHLKMLRKYGSIDRILQSYRQPDPIYERLSHHLQILNNIMVSYLMQHANDIQQALS